MAFIEENDYDAWQAEKRRLAAAHQAQTEQPAMPPSWQAPGDKVQWASATPEIGASQPAGIRTVPSSWMPPRMGPSINEATQILGLTRAYDTEPGPLETLAATVNVPSTAYSRAVTAPLAEIWTEQRTEPRALPAGLVGPSAFTSQGVPEGLRMPLLPVEQQNVGQIVQRAGTTLPEAWWKLGERQQARYETDPWGSTVTEAMVDPLNVLGTPVSEGLRNVGRLAKAGVEGPAPVVREATSTLRNKIAEGLAEGLANPERASISVKQVPETTRYYHGTGTSFDAPDASKFDKDGLFGPGYYLTNNPDVASSYADVRAGTVGQNVRAVDVPKNLNLYPALEEPVEPAVIEQIVTALPANQQQSFSIRANNMRWENPSRNMMTGDNVYKLLADVTNSKEHANETLAKAGFDGLNYPGGAHMPLLDADGQVVKHDAVVVFPEALPKITNAISGKPMGSAPEIGGAIVGGAAYQDDPTLTPEENMQRRALTAAAGGVVGHVAKRLGSKSQLGGTIEDVGKQGPVAETVGKIGTSREPDIQRYERLNQQYTAVQKRLEDIKDKLTGLYSEREAYSQSLGIQRPSWGVGWTDEELSEVAGRMGRNPFNADWGVDPDTAILGDYGPMRQGGGRAKQQQVINSEIRGFEGQLKATEAQARGLERSMKEALSTERIPVWRDPTLAEEAERLADSPAKPADYGNVPPPPSQTTKMPEWNPSDKPQSNPAPLRPAADPYQQLVDALTPTKTQPREQVQIMTDKFLTAMYDRNWHAVEIERATGIPAHKLTQIVPGSVAYGEYLLDTQVDPVLKTVGKDIKELEQYMVARRDEDILARNPAAKLPGGIEGWGNVQRAIDTLKERMGQERFAKIEDAAKAIWGEPGHPETGLNYQLVLKPRLDAGMLTKEGLAALTSAHPHYISFYREDFAGLQTGLSRGRGEANVTNAGLDTMEIAGSNRKLDNPLARFRAQVINTQHLIAENNAAKAIVEGLTEMERLGATSKTAAREPLTTGERFVKVLESGQTIPSENNVWGTISYMQDGQKVTAQVPKPIATMAKGLEAETANFWSRIARAASFPLRAGAVTYNAAFIPKNIIRDLNSAFYREGLQPLSGDYVGGWMAAIAHNSDFADAAKAGVLMSGIVDTMRSTDAMTRAYRPGVITVNSWQDALLALPRVVKTGLLGVERAGMISEQATRIATYKKLRAQGLDQLDAAVRARDVTVDFGKAGNLMKLINQAIPFSNAGVQGMANTARTMRYNPKQAIIGASPLVALSILAWANNQRYETSKMIPEREYANNWILQVGEGSGESDPKFPNKPPDRFPIYMRIPKGSLGGLLTAPAEMALRYAWANNDRSVLDDVGGTLGTMAVSLSPIEPSMSGMLPPLPGTMIGLTAGSGGYDYFRGQPIVPRSEQERPPELQYGQETSREAIALGERFHVSPRMIDWAIKDATGGVGSQTLWMSDLILGAVGYNPTTFGAAKQQPTSQIQQLARAPITGGFLGVQNKEQTNRGWAAFDNAVVEAQRKAAQVPELKRLGITFGPVDDKVSVGKANVVLTPKERAELQELTTNVLMKLVPELMKNRDYQKAPLAQQAQVMRDWLNKGRDAARARYMERMPGEALERRLIESLPIPVNQ